MEHIHEVQKHMLKVLFTSTKARYSDLKPKNVEGNLFTYHLKKLIIQGIIKVSPSQNTDKNTENKRYSLTSAGRQYADRFSLSAFKERIQPKIVTLIVLKNKSKEKAKSIVGNVGENRHENKNDNYEYLLYKRSKTPFINHIGFPYGKIHLEERIQDSANRELKEKTGLTAKLKHRGIAYITVHNETDLVSHMLCHIFSGTNIEGELNRDDCFWSKFATIPKTQLIPGVLQIKKLLDDPKNKNKFFFEEFFLNSGEEI